MVASPHSQVLIRIVRRCYACGRHFVRIIGLWVVEWGWRVGYWLHRYLIPLFLHDHQIGIDHDILDINVFKFCLNHNIHHNFLRYRISGGSFLCFLMGDDIEVLDKLLIESFVAVRLEECYYLIDMGVFFLEFLMMTSALQRISGRYKIGHLVIEFVRSKIRNKNTFAFPWISSSLCCNRWRQCTSCAIPHSIFHSFLPARIH